MCAYIRRTGENLEILTVWVDDLLLFTSTDELMTHLKTQLHSIYELTDISEPNKIVGIEVFQDESLITIRQTQYIEQILKREGMENANPVKTPMDHKLVFEPNPDGEEGNRSNAFAQLIGSLQYLATATCPDIAYAVNRLAAYTANPSLAHYTAAKRILRYLAGTKDYGITYRKEGNNPEIQSIFYGYADAAWANSEEHRSMTGYVFLAGGGAITWGSRKQTLITLSSTEAEYIALAEVGREALWLYNLYKELGFHIKEPVVIKEDNNRAMAMAKNAQYHKRSKHIDIRWHWIREQVNNGLIQLVECRDPQQTADILTKALTPEVHNHHVAAMGLSSAGGGVLGC